MAMTEEERQDFYELQKMMAAAKVDISCLVEVVFCLLPIVDQNAGVRAGVLTFLKERLDRSQVTRTRAEEEVTQNLYARQERFFRYFIKVIWAWILYAPRWGYSAIEGISN